MKRFPLAVCLLVLVFAVSIWAQYQTTISPRPKRVDVERELLTLEKDWGNALVKSDTAFIDRVTTEDWTWTGPDGNVFTKAQSLAMLKSGEDLVSSLVTDNMKARVYGDAAVVTGRNTVKETMKGKDVSGQYQWTDFFVKRDGRWLCMASVGSKVPQK